jgi:hypothetical protein
VPVLTENSTSLTVAENSLATTIGIPLPTDANFATSALTVTITALPSDGMITLSDGITPLTLGETLTVAQLAGLKFLPTPSAFGQSATLAFTVSDPTGNSVAATATVAIGASNQPLIAQNALLTVAANSPATAIGIAAPSDANSSATLTVKVTGLPKDGTVLLSNGTAVTVGEVLTVAQLMGLEFKPTTTSADETSTFTYSVTDSAGNSASGSVLLGIVADAAPVTAAASLTVAQNAGATAIGIPAPTDANFGSSSLSVTVSALPQDGTVVLSNGPTAVTVGEALTVQQLTGLEFVSTPGASATSSSFTYSVSDPSGATSSGSATLSIGAANAALVTTPASLTVGEDSGPTPIGIQAPSDANFAASALTVTVTALPNDGTVFLADGKTVVTVGESLTVAQLTGLEFMLAQDNGQTSTFAYSVADPAGKTATGTATLIDPNAIVLENEKPGTPESVWQIEQDSTNIEGFTTAISTNIGGTVNFKINTDSAHYVINIYRLGYYGGDGARLVASIDHNASSAIVQPNPIVDPATGLVDAGNWSVTDSWNVPTAAVSGVYVADLIREDKTAGAFQIPFVIRNDSSHSDIVFQTDDETWQAYNGWGGANLYGGNGPAPVVNLGSAGTIAAGAAFAVSYNRPIMTRDGVGTFAGPQDMVFGAEYPAIQWLEQNGYDVSYISGIDTATNGSLLLNHKVFMDVGHDEYWTDSQAANVQAAAKAGVSLAFLSGNEMFWQTRLAPSIDGSGTSNRTLVSYKDTHFNKIVDPTGTATGSFLDPRFGPVTPTNAITGTYFQADANRADTITIPFDMTRLRLWRNTAVANTAAGQTASLTPGYLGYEWDSSPDNGFRPAGLVDLSSTTLQISSDVSNFGNAEGPGTATHNLVEFRDPTSGALVFGAGTVFWSWGLSADHDPTLDGLLTDGAVPADPNVQQATVNFLADMGVQPATLQASLVIASQSTDHTPPKTTISSISAASVVEGGTVTVTGTSTDAGGGVIGGVEVSDDSGKTWHPANSPVGTTSVNWTYSFTAPAPGNYTIEARAVDDSINLETPGPGVSYTVTPSTALSLFSSSSTPATVSVNDPQAVNLGMKFTTATPGLITGFRFYKGPQNAGTHVASLWTTSGTLLAQATFTNETASGWQQVNLSTPVMVTAGTTYVVSYHTNGNYSASDGFFANVNDAYVGVSNGSLTAPTKGTNGLFIYSSSSVMPTTVSSSNYFVDVVFSDTVNDPQANNASFVDSENNTLNITASSLLALDTDPHGQALSITGVSNAVNGTVSYNSSTQTISFVPNTNFTGAASFTYSIADTGGQTASGTVNVAVNYPITAQSIFGTGVVPTNVTVNDPQSVELGVKFQASVTGLVSGIRFYKGPQNTGPHTGELWTASGTRLATVTFTNETASGWQEANFSSPVLITAGTTYVASYHTSSGDYSGDGNFFTSAVTNQSLTALSNATSVNGLYAYGSGPLFPTNSFQATNYYVDVVFNGTPDQAVAGAVGGLSTAENTALSIPASTLLANDIDTAGNPLSVTGVSNAVNGSVTYNSGTQTVTFTPNAGYVGPANFTYSIGDGKGATATGNVSLGVNYPVSAQSLFFPTDTPGTVTANDPSAVELGVKFQAATNGEITAIRFYKGPSNTGTHIGDLWSSSGTLLATATFTNETASGWQQANLSTPVMTTAGTTYIASYHTSSGDYSADANYFSTAHANGALTALANSTSADGVYAYGAGSTFPTNSFGATNYWVDVVFNGSSDIATANPVTGLTTPENTALSIPASTILANDTDSAGNPLSITGVSNASNGSVSYNASTQTVTFTPTTAFTGGASFNYSISDGQGATATGNASLTVTPPANAQTLFFTSDTPATPSANDPNAAELGVKFQASTNGEITGIRFYKGSLNTGTHVGDLWTTSGSLLASATFTNETASGWQEVDFTNPVAITAGTTYVAAYHTSSGDYASTANYFTTAHTNGSLTAPSSSSSGGNGVYAYGATDQLPTSTFNAANYWVDVVFKPQLAS